MAPDLGRPPPADRDERFRMYRLVDLSHTTPPAPQRRLPRQP
jgi:hypothetical protein